MKTPIQEIISRHENRLHETDQNKTAFWYLEALVKDLKYQLSREREDIEQAYIKGYNQGCYDHSNQPLEIESLAAADDYFNENYKQQEL